MVLARLCLYARRVISTFPRRNGLAIQPGLVQTAELVRGGPAALLAEGDGAGQRQSPKRINAAYLPSWRMPVCDTGLMGRLLAAVTALVLGVGAALAVLVNGQASGVVVSVVFGLLVGWSFVGAGLVAWRRRPDSRVGLLMCAVGLSWLPTLLFWSQDEWLFAASALFNNVPLVVYGHLLLAFPSGRLESRPARIVVAAGYVDAVAVQCAALLLISDLCPGCPVNPLAIMGNSAAGRTLVWGQQVVGLALITVGMVILAARWRRASGAQRRVMAPVLWTAPTFYLAAFAVIFTRLGYPQVYGVGSQILKWLFTVAATASAFGCLVGLLRSSLDRARVAELVVQLGRSAPPGELRAALVAALHDPSLSVVYWIPEQSRFVDPEGRPASLPASGEHGRAVTLIERGGSRIAALVHDAVLGEDPDLLEAVCAAAGFALENERLQAELRARLEELATSRTRLVAAADAERKRIERNLHDGAQQRLVGVSMFLARAAAKLPTDPAVAGSLLGEARAALAASLQELRELGRGIHPSGLAEHGLAAALHELAWTTPLPVALHCRLEGRLAVSVETAAYYVVAESLTNIVKHADATSARIDVHHRNAALVISVADDGRGGADPAGGTGLAGLADRVHAFDGTLDVLSPPGGGTTLTARLPCAS